jgi:hypothetical protein
VRPVGRVTLAIDAAIAVALAVLVLVIAPGVAVAAMIAIAALIVCGLSLALDRRGAGARRPRRPRGGARRRSGRFS